MGHLAPGYRACAESESALNPPQEEVMKRTLYLAILALSVAAILIAPFAIAEEATEEVK